MRTGGPVVLRTKSRAHAACECGDTASTQARQALRARALQHAVRERSLGGSRVGAAHHLREETVAPLVRAAFASHAGSTEAGHGVVWQDGSDELFVDPAKIRVATREGLVFVGIPAHCEESGPCEITVVFACNTAKDPLGVVLVAEETPRGPRVVVERWAAPLVACAYAAIVEALSASVVGPSGEPLLLAGIGADDRGFVVVMQRDQDDAPTPHAPSYG